MKRKSRYWVFFIFTVCIILGCMFVMIYASGFEHETQNAKNIFVTIVVVLAFQFVIADPIRYILVAIDMACWPRSMPNYKKSIDDDSDDDMQYNRLDFLKRRLRALKVQMLITERYRNEKLNREYKNISQDLFLYAKYFLVLLCVVMVSRNELMYYNTTQLQSILMNNHSDYIGLKEVYHLNQLFDFVESSLVAAFDVDDEMGIWVHAEQNIMVGVVRMRQLRLVREQIGWGDPEYTEHPYMPDWQLPHYEMHYTEKYWRIYDPWVPVVERDPISQLLLDFDHVGKFHNYPELKGYATLLGLSKQNSMKILEFLTEYHWLTYNTSAVFLDFTLYNVDADIFSVCTLRVEQTSFGSIIPDVSCDTVELIGDILQLSYWSLLVLLIYLVVVLQFIQVFVTQIWYEPSKLRTVWYKLDLVIVVLNIALIILVILRSALVSSMLRRLEGADKLDFLDFRKPARIHMLSNILAGFLISLTTLRLWKVLQFSKTFQLFTNTLFLAGRALAITGLMILIILMAFSLAFIIINGNNSPHFIHPLKSAVTAMCFAFGYSNEMSPSDLFYGGKYLGIFMYAALGFMVSVLLINVFITIINDYFLIARSKADAAFQRRITFWQFLRVEHDNFFQFLNKFPCFRKPYKRRDRTVAENIKQALDQREKIESEKLSIRKTFYIKEVKVEKDEETRQVEYRERIEHIYAVSTIINIQFEILERILFDDDGQEGNPMKKESPMDDDSQPPGSGQDDKYTFKNSRNSLV